MNSIGVMRYFEADYIELALAIALVALALARLRAAPVLLKLARSTGWSMLLLAALPVALRLALLRTAPAPVASTADDTSFLLLADTLAHFRLANPAHAYHRFFETNFVLQEPAYSSIFPLGQGIVLALGKAVFGHPWAGVLLSEAALCALCYWMLKAWVSPGWALAGGMLAVFQFGPLSYWMNTYWGGAVSGIAGCLVFGALARLREDGRIRNAVLLGVGLGVQLLTRPYEAIFLLLSAALFLLPRATGRTIAVASLAALPAIALTLAQNRAVTGSWTTLPYQLSREQYGVPTTFTFQPNPAPHRELSQEERDGYEAQSLVHDREARKSFGRRLADRLHWSRFFFLPPLYLALACYLFTLRDRRMLGVLLCVALFVAGTTFYPYFHPHYIAAIACLFVLMSVAGLERLGRSNPHAAALIFLLAVAHFIFWYGLHLTGSEDTVAALPASEGGEFVNHGDPEGRIAVLSRLSQAPGRQLVFVRFAPLHPLREWIGNEANIDPAGIVWALDLGRSENGKLRRYYPDRTVWLLEPDQRPPRLGAYPDAPGLHFEIP